MERYRVAGYEANAHAAAAEGLRLVTGPFCLAVRNKLPSSLSTVPSAA